MAAKVKVTRIELAKDVLKVAVGNRTESPIHAVSELGGIEYDSERRSLRLEFKEAEVDPGAVVGLPAPAVTTVIGPGEEMELSARLVSPLTSLVAAEDGKPSLVQIQIADEVETIECSVAYSEEQPPPLNLTAPEPARRAIEWETVTATTPLDPP